MHACFELMTVIVIVIMIVKVGMQSFLTWYLIVAGSGIYTAPASINQ